jgi:tetratricopeptide (TPR) repeat protein
VPARSEPDAERLRERWRVQATLLVRWALDGRTPAQRAAFFDFIERAAIEPITAADFQRCFGVDFATADTQLAAYLAGAAKKSMTLKPEQPIKLPKVNLRDADEGEISRIKGDWERLEVAFVKKSSPELAPKYLEQARRTLLRAHERGDRSPGLLANLGLCECDAGQDDKAREYLEAAALRGPLRPRANYELARLRFTELARNPEGGNGKLSPAQMIQVLSPLFAARASPPPFPEVYELIGEVWARSQVGPTRGHLAVLDEGVRLFPRRVPLIHQLAVLHAQRGDADDAANLVTLGLYLATDEGDRRRFTELQARLAIPAGDHAK